MADTTESITISSPGLSPSNRSAGFPNLARAEPFDEETLEAVTSICAAELDAAGINVHIFGSMLGRGEVPTKAIGHLSMWKFERAWYYWRASGPGIPPEFADRLHATHGTQVRVAGHCACPSPREWYKGFGVGDYHVDTPAGLKALADTLLAVYDARNDPEATPRTRD